MLRIAARTCARATSQMNCHLYAFNAMDDLIVHVDGEVRGTVWISVLAADLRIDEQAQMRIIDLDNGDTLVAEQFNLPAENRNAVAHEVFTSRISNRRLVGIPHSLAE